MFPDSFHLFLLVGQSNMAGRGDLTPADREPDPRIRVLNRDNDWSQQGEPVHFDKPELAGVGLGFTFAKLVAERETSVTIGLIPCAVGGTPLARWKPGADLYEAAIQRGRIALATGRLKGILWHQGEAECDEEVRAVGYSAGLAEVAGAFRRDLKSPEVPFIAGELGHFLYTRSNGKSPYSRIVNEQIRRLPAVLANAAAVSAAGLGHRGDELHFNAEALKEFGGRYFEAWMAVTERPSLP